MKRVRVAILGATGAVGQKFVRLLDGHPWFELAAVAASERSQGRRYGDAVHWLEDTAIPDEVADLAVQGVGQEIEADVLFSALPGGHAAEAERAYAAAGHPVFTNARDLRLADDVPLVVGEVNPEHLAMVEGQQEAHGSDGFVVANGNCTTITLAMTLKPLLDAFGLEAVHMVSMQALSGAGYPGVPSLDIQGNVLPWIRGEEEQVRREAPKFLGSLVDGRVVPAAFDLMATCTRVAVVEGHTEVVSVRTTKACDAQDVAKALTDFRGLPQRLELPSAPLRPIVVRSEPDRPQPARDWATGHGMSAVVGRIEPDPVVAGHRLITLSANTIRGAAGGSILNAELVMRQANLDN